MGLEGLVSEHRQSDRRHGGPDWLHEIKYNGYRLRVDRDGDRVRLITRGGYDWPTALKSKATSRSLLPVRRQIDPLGDVDSDLVAQRAY
jgi:ATP-dependent DNA ligase